jgi:hypothetical protein
MHIVCPHCHATNRVPVDKLEHEINCGKCHKPVFDAHPASATMFATTRLRWWWTFGRLGVALAVQWPQSLKKRPPCWSHAHVF